jgi:hypothetical protein
MSSLFDEIADELGRKVNAKCTDCEYPDSQCSLDTLWSEEPVDDSLVVEDIDTYAEQANKLHARYRDKIEASAENRRLRKQLKAMQEEIRAMSAHEIQRIAKDDMERASRSSCNVCQERREKSQTSIGMVGRQLDL